RRFRNSGRPPSDGGGAMVVSIFTTAGPTRWTARVTELASSDALLCGASVYGSAEVETPAGCGNAYRMIAAAITPPMIPPSRPTLRYPAIWPRRKPDWFLIALPPSSGVPVLGPPASGMLRLLYPPRPVGERALFD